MLVLEPFTQAPPELEGTVVDPELLEVEAADQADAAADDPPVAVLGGQEHVAEPGPEQEDAADDQGRQEEGDGLGHGLAADPSQPADFVVGLGVVEDVGERIAHNTS